MAHGNVEKAPEAYVPPPQTTKMVGVRDGCMEMENGMIVDRHTIAKYTGMTPDEVKTKVGSKIRLTFDSSDTIVGAAVFPDMGNGPELEFKFPPQTTTIVGIVDGCMELGNGILVDRHTIAKYTGLTPDAVKNEVGSEITLTFDETNTINGVTIVDKSR